jgi:hypothetical protein
METVAIRMKLCIIVPSILCAQAAVEQRQPWAGHHQHQRGAGQHPGVVARHLGVLDGLVQIVQLLGDIRRGRLRE